jgi:sugar O-acyltransferase (sialic acid O-acetyltransferase NeuD family)
MKRDLIIVGTGDYSEVAALYFLEQNQHRLLGFSEERAYIRRDSFMDLPIHPFEDLAERFSPSETSVFVAVGPGKINTIRERLYLQTKALGFGLEKFIHHRAHVWNPDAIGPNCCIFPFACVEPGASVGENSVLWTGSLLAHHSTIGNHCFLAPGARVSGRSTIRDHCFLGINSTVRDHVVVAERCIVGGGAVIKKDTLPGGVYSARAADLLDASSIDTRI